VSWQSIGVTPGVGAAVKADNVGGVYIQAFKLLDATENGSAGAPVDATKGLATFAADDVSTFHRVATGTSADTLNVKATSGRLRGWNILNIGDAPVYVKLHNTASAPTIGTAVVFAIPVTAGFPEKFAMPGRGRFFSTGIGISIVTGIPDASTVLVTADTVILELFYE